MLSITFSPPLGDFKMTCATISKSQIQSLNQPESFADPNFRLHKPELRSYTCLVYEPRLNLLLSYITVNKTVSVGLN